MIAHTVRRVIILPLGLSMLSSIAQAQTQTVVGHISFARGSNAAQQAAEPSRLLGQGAEVYAGDNIQTAERSFVIIEFVDGAKVTVRPNSSFSIDQYNNQAGQKKASMVLHQGAVQASTGAIAQQQAENFQIKARETVVTAERADYSVQLCDQQCVQQQAKQAAEAAIIVARIVDIKGMVSAKSSTDAAKERSLALGDALYNTDTLYSQKDSYALMVFPDGEKITLQADSQLLIQDYAYHVAGKKDNALFRLVKGSMRALTGAIGKENKGSYSVNTPVATIGIRGTGFDLNCVGDCIASPEQQNDVAKIQLGQVDGLYSYVWQGEIVLHNEQGDTLLAMPNSNYIATLDSSALAIPKLPDMMQHPIAPRPDSNKSDIKQLFAAKTPRAAAGVYFAVQKGQAKLATGSSEHATKNDTVLKENEQAYVGEQNDTATRLTESESLPLETYNVTAGQNSTDANPLFENTYENAATTESCAE